MLLASVVRTRGTHVLFRQNPTRLDVQRSYNRKEESEKEVFARMVVVAASGRLVVLPGSNPGRVGGRRLVL